MRKQLISGVSLVALLIAASSAPALLSGHANAADLGQPVYKAPPPAPAPVFSWTGCYVGGHVGWGWGHSTFRDHSTSNIFSAGGGGPTGGLIDASDLQRTASVDQSGGLFGGQVGCDYQFNYFVVGISGSVAGADINGTAANPFSFVGPGGLITANTDFLADVSGRLGFTWNQVLFYAKGGFAWVHSKYTTDCVCDFDAATTFTASNTATGAIAGAGIEWAFARNWSAFAEYDHYFLDTQTLNFTDSGSFDGPLHGLVDVKENINAVKVGVNYRFSYQ
jgi:outer membrane immunogenic protein